MKTLFLSWIGKADLEAANPDATSQGPIITALIDDNGVCRYDAIRLLSNYSSAENNRVKRKLQALVATDEVPIIIKTTDMENPTDYIKVYEATNNFLKESLDSNLETDAYVNLSSGTPAMTAVWILLCKTLYKTKFVQSSAQQGFEQVNIPFDISAEFTPRLPVGFKGLLEEDGEHGLAGFSAQSDVMKIVIELALKASAYNVSVIITGEPGTGKETLARAIHLESERRDNPFKVIKCGALSEEVLDDLLFGNTENVRSRVLIDQVMSANGGTLYLDELADLPLATQIKLVDALKDHSSADTNMRQPAYVDLRVIASTSKDLLEMVQNGTFKSDLYYLLHEIRIELPRLRDRTGDLAPLIEEFMRRTSKLHEIPEKRLLPKARNRLLQHGWPGNVSELKNTITRLLIWSNTDTITVADVNTALISAPTVNVVDKPESINPGFNLNDRLAEIEKQYIEVGLKQFDYNRSRTAESLGYNNYQTLNNKIKTLGIDVPEH